MSTPKHFDFKFYELEKIDKDKTFLRQPFGDHWEEYTWGETGQMARKLATGLKSLGLRPNAHIGLISKNCREWVIADLAIIMAGYISVPFFATLTGKELGGLLDFGDVDNDRMQKSKIRECKIDMMREWANERIREAIIRE